MMLPFHGLGKSVNYQLYANGPHMRQGQIIREGYKLNTGLSDYAKQKKDLDPIGPFAFFVKNHKGQILAGCSGDILYGCLYTGSLWVSESMPGKGIGTRLMQFAREKGCTMATLIRWIGRHWNFTKTWVTKSILLEKGIKTTLRFIF